MRPHRPRLALIAGLLALAGAPTGAAGHGDEAHPKPAAAAAPRFEPPAPGSYELPAILHVEERSLVGGTARSSVQAALDTVREELRSEAARILDEART